MRETFLPFSKPSINDNDVAAVSAVMRSGWLTTGKECQAFEEEFANCVGAKSAVAVASATGGMHILLSALGIGPGDEVITPSLTWVSTPNLVSLAGAVPVWAEVDRGNLMITAETVAPLVTERTRAIIPVHYAGAAADMAPLRALAAEKNIPLIEDAAHAAGTRYRGQPIGEVGTSVFSFHPIKNVTTGEGGMICSDDEELLNKVRRLKFHGLAVDAFDRETQGRKPQAMVVEPGYKYNMTDMAAALGRTQLARLDDMNRRRAEIAGLYAQRFDGMPEILPLSVPDWPHEHSWHLYIVRLDKPGLSRDEFIERLKRRNIGTGIHFLAAHTHGYYKAHAKIAPELPNTEWNSERILSLPLFPDMTDADVDDVVAGVKDSLAKG